MYPHTQYIPPLSDSTSHVLSSPFLSYLVLFALVSMIPPLALNVEPHHKCLDMCAAPGSKTSQLLEIVSRSLDRPETEHGLVVANDSDTDRAYMLVHQCRRVNSPLLVVTTHKGQDFPHLNYKSISTVGASDGNTLFDRVLADVPCSGDGNDNILLQTITNHNKHTETNIHTQTLSQTAAIYLPLSTLTNPHFHSTNPHQPPFTGTMRKNMEVWTKWATFSGLSLHPLQLTIAKRGIQLLKPGGLLVYSTCSLSPYEDEAVVAELLRSHPGQLELVIVKVFVFVLLSLYSFFSHLSPPPSHPFVPNHLLTTPHPLSHPPPSLR